MKHISQEDLTWGASLIKILDLILQSNLLVEIHSMLLEGGLRGKLCLRCSICVHALVKYMLPFLLFNEIQVYILGYYTTVTVIGLHDLFFFNLNLSKTN